MNILINASNLKKGGGLQVAISLIELLYKYTHHNFIVVCSSYLIGKINKDVLGGNVSIFEYNIKHNFRTIFLGRDKFLDALVYDKNIQSVLTVFGPSLWVPKCKHVSGFARAQIILTDSPYFDKMNMVERIYSSISNIIMTYLFKRCSNIYYTENSAISEKLKKKIGKTYVYTVTNYYNQIYDNPSLWITKKIEPFDGISILTISAAYSHKNLEIASGISMYLRFKYPTLKFRFVYTIDKQEYGNNLDADNIVFLGSVDICECPSLYQQCDIVFQPTLLECFTATYVEAMRMKKPIITTDLSFARGLCGDAAMYYDAISCEDAAEKIVQLYNNKRLEEKLITEGSKRLAIFDDYISRSDKLISICES